uniref:Cytochrome P450 n=1 Tax=Timema douglasi TaxID=61478 RepID=A0A7R8VDN3_TIMDO|nr:unnamed protein product [Timema douglasi]
MLTLVLFVGILGLILYKLTSKPKNFPPGPFRWPVIGNVLKFKLADIPTYLVMQDLKRSHGNVAGFFMAKSPMVLVSGLAEIREALAKPEFQGRPISAVNKMEKERLGMVFNDGDIWRDTRRFTLRHLREMGMGKHSMEEQIQEETRALMKDAKRMAGDDWSQPVPVHDLIAASGVNIILQLIAGYRFERDDPRMSELMNLVKNLTMKINTSGGLASSFPILLRVFPWLTEYPAFKAIRDEIRQYCQEMINDHEKKLDENDASDFLDTYLIEMKKNGETSTFNTRQLIGVVSDLFIAGSDTTTGALAYGILNMVLNPKIQNKIQDEIDAVVGRERLPSSDDRIKMPYTDATINEILRFANVAPLAVPHSVLISDRDVTFRGEIYYGHAAVYMKQGDGRTRGAVILSSPCMKPPRRRTDCVFTVPGSWCDTSECAVVITGSSTVEGTRIIINLFDLHMDRKYWGDPDNFRPERFLESSGTVRKDEALLPFGQGKRSCVGESLARVNLFITFTSLLQNFALRLPEGVPRPSTEPEGGLTFTTKPFSIVMKPRNV